MLRRLQSFGDKVTALAAAASGIAVALVCTALVLVDYFDLRDRVFATVESQAAIVAMNSGAPLAFGDVQHATEALDALGTAPNVAAAELFRPDGRRFAAFRRADTAAPELPLLRAGHHRIGDWRVFVQPVVDRGQRLGDLQVVYDLGDVHERLAYSAIISLLVALVAMAVAWLVAARLKRQLVEPIDALADTARRVSQTRDFAIRAERHAHDEIGVLTDAFNEMLGEIEAQSAQISEAATQRQALLESERQARAEAERASRMKDEFVATLSHELRTPMTPILGWVQVLRRTAGDPSLAKGLEAIERNARVQTQIIDDLLDMSAIVSGKVRLDIQPVRLADVIEAAVATVRPAAEARGIELVVALDPGIERIRGDAGRLQQVMWNLLSNAIKFTDRDGRVRVVLEARPRMVEVSVSDTGRGIDPAFLPHVFERFRQADSSSTREHGGLGLGLAIVKQLVELHGGTIRAESAGRGMGARFVVALPRHVPEAAGATPQPARAAPVRTDPSPSRLSGVRVLVVDDERDACELLLHLLREAGADAQCETSAAAAYATLTAWRPDVLVSDIGMPHEDGYALITRVRNLPAEAGGGTPAIALTAFARPADRARALDAGYQSHLAKPLDPAGFIAEVARLAGRVTA
jgi:signal transduction histidine kinase/CheY-like chemotaxis protein